MEIMKLFGRVFGAAEVSEKGRSSDSEREDVTAAETPNEEEGQVQIESKPAAPVMR